MKKKILFVVTSHGELGLTGKPTGYYLSEVTHPMSVLDSTFEIDVVSPKGGRPPVEGVDLTDPINRKYWDSPEWQDKMSKTLTPDQINPADYAAIFYAGGHGVMWDLPNNAQLQKIAATIYENGGYVSAVCHGPAGIVNLALSNGELLIHGKKFDCFTNEEEKLVGTVDVMPFLLQTDLQEHGGIFEGEAPWSDHVVVDGRLITGQNPQSALSVGNALLAALQSK